MRMEALVAGDVDGDGDVDFMGASVWNPIQTILFRNDGTGIFTQVYQGANNFQDMAGGDVDDDGDIDFVGAGRRNTTTILYRNNGAGVFTQEPLV